MCILKEYGDRMKESNKSRQNTNVDLKMFDKLIEMKVSKAQIARTLGVSRTTVYRLTGNIKYEQK